MEAYQQLELVKMRQRHVSEEEELKRKYDEDVNNISRGLIIDGSADQLFYHMKGLRIGACVLACVLAYIFCKDSGFGSFLLWAGILSGVFLVALNMCRSARLSAARNQVENDKRCREDRLKRDQQTMRARHQNEEKKLQDDIVKKMNAYAREYCSKPYTTLLIEWLLNELQLEINKADRSPFYANVKAGISFEVSRDQIRVPGRTSYNMRAQGFGIQDDSLAISALAKVLCDSIEARGSARFAKDPAGGAAVVTCKWNRNTGVDVSYSAVNGNVGKPL